MVYRSIGISIEQTIKEAFEKAKIEAIVYSHRPSGSAETIIDTTEHDEEIRMDERKKALDEVYAIARLEGISEFAKAVKEFIYTYRYGNDDLIAFIEEYIAKEGRK